MGRPRNDQLLRLLRSQARQPPEALEGASRQHVVETLARMMGPGKVVLLEGPAGSGKSTAVALATRRILQPPRVACISGRDFSQPEQAFHALILALGGKGYRRDAVEGRQYLTFRLAELKKENVFVVVVLNDCEMFATGKQSLLYALFDLTQDPDVRMVVVLTTRTQDFVAKLEKRLESRLGTQRLVMPSLSEIEAERIVRSVLTANASDDPDQYLEWNQTLATLHLSPAVTCLHRINRSNIRYFVNFAWTLLAAEGSVDDACHLMMHDVWRARMENLSEIELCVLVVMLRPENLNLSFSQAYDTYKKEMELGRLALSSKQLFSRAWDNLISVASFSAFPPQVLRQVVKLEKWSTDFQHWANGGVQVGKR